MLKGISRLELTSRNEMPFLFAFLIYKLNERVTLYNLDFIRAAYIFQSHAPHHRLH
jgi:hypothetical protein